MGRQRTKKGRPISGWLVLDKPFDFGSTESVSKIKWLFKAQKVGHAGTLDPLASGMLPIALGEATKTVPYVMDGRKVYQFTVSWGQERTTDDLEGDVIQSSDARPTITDIEAILSKYVGVIDQIPPQFSAIKIDGERAYDIARGGETIDIPAREVEIFDLKITDGSDPDATTFEVECGKGTYVRSLARDMGRDLGCYGHIAYLRRNCVLPFKESQLVALSDLVAFEEIEDEEERLAKLDAFLIGSSQALSALPQIQINSDQAKRLKFGNPILLLGASAPANEAEAYATIGSKLIAVGEVLNGEFLPKRVFNDA